MSMADRLAAPLHYRPEVVSMNMGSFNFNISHAGSKVTEWKYDWEQPYLEATKNIIVSNTFTQIENAIILLNENDTRFEYEVYDNIHLHTLELGRESCREQLCNTVEFLVVAIT